ncbi:MAG: STAS/SEC14 domain-containing protein [Proteobacteria bacterium]|nr:STAS/SEC14 domain-containing protein [Pseudomonadota bacterium]
MIEQMKDMPAGTLGFIAHGQVTAADYENLIVPDIEAAFQLNRQLRMLYVIAEDFTGFEAGAMWDDARLGIRHFLGWERAALVTDVTWLRSLAHAMGLLVPAEFRLFRLAEFNEARNWICEGL